MASWPYPPMTWPSIRRTVRRDAQGGGRGGVHLPLSLDETQEVAKAYRAACTPDFFLFDGERKLVYRGQFDGSRPGNEVPVTGEDLRAAADAVLAGGPVPEEQSASIGCNIKWKPGNAPDYFGLTAESLLRLHWLPR